MACTQAGVAPRFVDVSPADPVSYVLSINLHRRHLTPSQLAMVGARAREIYDKQAKERQKLSGGQGIKGPVNLPDLKGDSRDLAGKAVGVSGKSIDHATRVLNKGVPELAKAVDEGRMAISTAALLATEPPEVQVAEVSQPKRQRVYKPEQYVPKPGDGRDIKIKPDQPKIPPQEGKPSGVGALRGYEAVDCLRRIPKNDPTRNRGFQIVMDWIRHAMKED